MQTIENVLDQITVGAPVSYRNLTVFPLFGSDTLPPTRDYLTLDEALAQNLATVTEVSEGGNVPILRLKTEGERPVLLMDGEALIGAKQNRILNLTLLAPAGESLNIPVSCVEAGRWSHNSAEFATSSHAQFAEGRARKMAHVSESMRASGGKSHYSDQSEVWSDIAVKASRMDSHSATSAMSEIYEQHEGGLEEYAGEFRAGEKQTGAVFAINGRVVGLELFDSPQTFAGLLPKLTRSYALDALDKQGEEAIAPSQWAVDSFLKAVAASKAEQFASIGIGEDARLSGEGMAGAALLVDNRVVHLSAFRQEEATTSEREPAYA